MTRQTRSVEPGPGMVVLSVLGPNGEGDSVDPFTDTLMVEVVTSASPVGANSNAVTWLSWATHRCVQVANP